MINLSQETEALAQRLAAAQRLSVEATIQQALEAHARFAGIEQEVSPRRRMTVKQMLAFGSDSLVELLSAMVVLLQWVPNIAMSERRASRAAGVLLFVLAFVVAATAVGSIALRWRPETSRAGIGITIAALIAMPILASLKRREARRSGNAALAADAMQSATCAYIALIALAGLTANAVNPYCVVRFDCCVGSHTHPHQRGQIDLARTCVWLLLSA